MTPQEQAEFIRGLAKNVSEEMARKAEAGQLPEHWNGHELRRWMKDRFALVSWGEMDNKRGKRYKDYYNTVTNENLL